MDEAWHGEVAEQNPAVYSVIGTAGEAHGRALKSYLIMMAVRLLEMRRILKPTGSIYLHCDPTASHYLKLLLDRVAPTFVLKYNIRIRSLADQSAIEDVLAVEDDVVPFDRADVLGAGLRQGLPW